MNILSIVLGSDPAGISSGMARAFDRYGGDDVLRSMVTKINYIEYDQDVPWDARVAAGLWEAADLVHLHHGFVSADRMVRGRFVGRRLNSKPYVVTYHGTGFRENTRAEMDELHRRGAIGLVSTLDLHLVSGLDWMPALVDLETLAEMRQVNGDKVVICHAPTNREIKSTDLLLKAVTQLQADGYPVELDLIEHRPWAECLERKAKSDIYFDQIILGYGCNALEAWAMGIPVVAGAADETLDEMERRFGFLPFYHATEETIYDALKDLVESPELRQRYGQIGQAYVRTYHDYPVVVEQLQAIYQQAISKAQEKAA